MATFGAMVSHSSRDAQAAQKVCELLEARGLRCWIAPRDLRPGERWSDGIVRGIESASAVVLIVSRHVNDSPHVLAEVTQAVNLGRPIFPLVIDDVRLSRGLDYYLRPLHWLFVESASFEGPVDIVCEAMTGVRDWNDAAPAPSIGRRLRHGSWRPIATAFAGSFIAIALAGAGAWVLWRVQAQSEANVRNASYLSVGWVTLSSAVRPIPTPAGESPWTVSGSLFLAGQQPGRLPLRLVIANEAAAPTATAQEHDVSSQIESTGAGNARTIEFSVPDLARRIAICLTLPHPSLATPYRVQQFFQATPSVSAGMAGVERWEFTPASDPAAAPDTGSPCPGASS